MSRRETCEQYPQLSSSLPEGVQECLCCTHCCRHHVPALPHHQHAALQQQAGNECHHGRHRHMPQQAGQGDTCANNNKGAAQRRAGVIARARRMMLHSTGIGGVCECVYDKMQQLCFRVLLLASRLLPTCMCCAIASIWWHLQLYDGLSPAWQAQQAQPAVCHAHWRPYTSTHVQCMQSASIQASHSACMRGCVCWQQHMLDVPKHCCHGRQLPRQECTLLCWPACLQQQWQRLLCVSATDALGRAHCQREGHLRQGHPANIAAQHNTAQQVVSTTICFSTSSFTNLQLRPRGECRGVLLKQAAKRNSIIRDVCPSFERQTAPLQLT